jgi:hypothetical protein
MNSQSSNNIYNNPNINSSLDHQLKKINYQNKVPCLSYVNQNQDNQKNIQYFPIATKESFTGQHTLYLAAEGDININDYETNNEYNSDKNNIKNKNTNLYILPQRTIDVEIKKTKFEHLSVKNEAKNRTNKIKNNLDNLYTNKVEETKNCNYQNIKNNFISTTKNLFELSKDKKNKELVHSLSVENYSDNILNKSLSNINENLEKLENSKIMDENFIISIKDSKRKDNLLKAIERYKRFKSLGKINIKDPLNSNNNIAKTTYKFIEIKLIFLLSLQIVNEPCYCQCHYYKNSNDSNIEHNYLNKIFFGLKRGKTNSIISENY